MSSFSERNGYKPARTLAQIDALDDETRMSLWNTVAFIPEWLVHQQLYSEDERVAANLWTQTFGRARDEVPSATGRVWGLVKASILSNELNRTMDAIEDAFDFLSDLPEYAVRQFHAALVDLLNKEFSTNLVGYRMIDGQIVPLDNQIEVEAVEEGIGGNTPPTPRHHLRLALDHLADRENPDYLNSIKESVSAVESIARTVTGESTLGKALPKLSANGIETHQALVRAWSGFYGYASDADGLRHGGEEVTKVDQAFAKYVLITCSAFVTWLTEEARVAGKL